MSAGDRARVSTPEQRADLVRASAGGAAAWPAPWRWNWTRTAARDPSRLLDDAFLRPSVRPLEAWTFSALVALIAWIGWRYAGSAPERASGLLPDGAPWLAIAMVAALVVMVYAKRALAAIAGPLRDHLSRFALRRVGPLAYSMIRAGVLMVWRTPSVVVSAVDWLLARPFALLAGARAIALVGPRFSAPVRYAILSFWIGGAALASVMHSHDRALLALAPGFLASLGVVRRWMWIERDRRAFLIERGAPKHIRVGFEENLRNEALFAAVGFLALVPMALHGFDAAYGAFSFFSANGAPIDGKPPLLFWLGFLGAELIKPVLFVDWDDAYRAAAGSFIRPSNGSGAALVFLVRAAIDLALITGVVQTAQIAMRLSRQKAAFAAGKLSSVDPLSERAVFSALAQRKLDAPILRKLSDAASDFPTPANAYDERRLAEIAAGPEPRLRALVASDSESGDGAYNLPPSPAERDGRIRNAAMLALACRYPTSPRMARLLGSIAARARSEQARRERALTLLVESNPEAAQQPLLATAADSDAEPQLRMRAVCDLGWLRRPGASVVLSAVLSEASADPLLRIHAGFSLVKTMEHTEETLDALRRLQAISLMRDDSVAILASTCALTTASLKTGANAEAPVDIASHPLVARAAQTSKGELDKTMFIRPGRFLMGAAPREVAAEASEAPQREVSLSAFELGAYEVTFEEYDSFCDATGRERPASVRWGRERRPVIHVSWEDAEAYCEWLNRWTGERYRLPSEAEWEYACRAGTTTPFSFGDTISTDQANYDGAFAYGNGVKGLCRQRAAEVGSFSKNAFGLYDMHGNVWEWCADAWGESYERAPIDGAARLSNDALLRVLRGGAWNCPPDKLRSAARFKDNPSRRASDTGFRVAKSVPPA